MAACKSGRIRSAAESRRGRAAPPSCSAAVVQGGPARAGRELPPGRQRAYLQRSVAHTAVCDELRQQAQDEKEARSLRGVDARGGVLRGERRTQTPPHASSALARAPSSVTPPVPTARLHRHLPHPHLTLSFSVSTGCRAQAGGRVAAGAARATCSSGRRCRQRLWPELAGVHLALVGAQSSVHTATGTPGTQAGAP